LKIYIPSGSPGICTYVYLNRWQLLSTSSCVNT
jgi:hypothetical protein